MSLGKDQGTRMNGQLIMVAGVVCIVLLVCSGCSTPSLPPSRFDAEAARAKSAVERQARGMSPLCRFVGEFTDGGLPKERGRAIPLDGHGF